MVILIEKFLIRSFTYNRVFQIIPDLDPLRKGSRGAGIVLDKGVITMYPLKMVMV